LPDCQNPPGCFGNFTVSAQPFGVVDAGAGAVPRLLYYGERYDSGGGGLGPTRYSGQFTALLPLCGPAREGGPSRVARCLRFHPCVGLQLALAACRAHCGDALVEAGRLAGSAASATDIASVVTLRLTLSLRLPLALPLAPRVTRPRTTCRCKQPYVDLTLIAWISNSLARTRILYRRIRDSSTRGFGHIFRLRADTSRTNNASV